MDIKLMRNPYYSWNRQHYSIATARHCTSARETFLLRFSCNELTQRKVLLTTDLALKTKFWKEFPIKFIQASDFHVEWTQTIH